MDNNRQQHWEQVYRSKAHNSVSWFQPQAVRSLQMMAAAGISHDQPVIDVGGGASVLVDDLLGQGFADVTVLDLSVSALAAARNRLGEAGQGVHWLEGDITHIDLPAAKYALWHDRAVFHFLTEPAQRAAYKQNLLHALRPDGQVILSTFAEDGPEKCSGLPVQRYSVAALHAEFSPVFDLLSSQHELHTTPGGSTQSFVYVHLKRRAG